MDPASIVGLVEFGLSCASAISRVAVSIHGGAADARKLITAIEGTVLVVKELDRVIDENRRTGGFDGHGLRLVRASRAECEDVLERLRRLLLKAGEFYKLRAADIERSVFRKADWARHKSGFEAVTRDLEAVKNSVIIALQVYSIRVARRAEEKERGLRELVELLQYFKDTGKAVEDIVPKTSRDTEGGSSTTPSEAQINIVVVEPEPGGDGFVTPPLPSDVDEVTGSSRAVGSDVDVMAASYDGSSEAPSSSSASRRDPSPSSSASPNPQDDSPGNSSTNPAVLENLGNSPLWHRVLRNILDQSSRRPKLESGSRRKRDANIPHFLRDGESQDGVATTRSFLLSKNGSEEWTFREWEYPLHELTLPQPCRDLITQISQHDTEEHFFWTALLLDPMPSRRRSWIARLLRKDEGHVNDVSGVLAVLERCRRIVDLDSEVTRALEELGTFVSQNFQLKIENEVLRATHLRGGVEARAEKRVSGERTNDPRAPQEAKATIEELAAMKAAAEEERRSGQDKQLLGIRESIIALRDDQIAREKAMEAQRAAEKAEKAEAAAEKQKAAEDAVKLLNAAKRAREEAERRAEGEAKAKEEAAKKAETAAAPKAEEKMLPIAFEDAVGRKFTCPWHISCTWKGMEELINQAFSHVAMLGPHVRDGHYDLLGPDGVIILPQVWDTLVQPGWQVTMHMWPMDEPEPPPKPQPMPPPPPHLSMEWMPFAMPPPPGSGKKTKRARRGPGKIVEVFGRKKSAKKPKPKQMGHASSIRHRGEPLTKAESLSPVEELAKRALVVYTGTGELFGGLGGGAGRESLPSSSSRLSDA